MCACACVSALRLLITIGMIWTPYDWLNKFYSFYLVAVVSIISRRGLRIDGHCRNQLNKSKLVMYKLRINPLSSTYYNFKTIKQLCINDMMGYKTGGKQRFIFLVLLEPDHMSYFTYLDYRLSLSILKI